MDDILKVLLIFVFGAVAICIVSGFVIFTIGFFHLAKQEIEEKRFQKKLDAILKKDKPNG